MRNNQKNFGGIIARVDTQVVCLVFVFTFLATIITSAIYWDFTFQVMMSSLEERAYALHGSIEESFDTETFQDISTPGDMDKELYQQSKATLLKMKNNAGVLYLYTAKVNEQGEFVYVIDGLELEGDFREPGDAIEEEIIPDMQLALSGEAVLPDEIVHTDWGEIFIAYFPVHDSQGEVLGVVGIEFDASTTYDTYQNLLAFIPLIVLILSSLASFASIIIFRRISNPLYKDMSTQDIPTGLKNRNAFDVAIHNYTSSNQLEGIGIVMMDLDNLKQVNDQFGHSKGDEYIRFVSDIIKTKATSKMVGYRIGGDEFVVIVMNASIEHLEDFKQQCAYEVENQTKYKDMKFSISSGVCIFDIAQDKDLEDTFLRADRSMYEEKRKHKTSDTI